MKSAGSTAARALLLVALAPLLVSAPPAEAGKEDAGSAAAAPTEPEPEPGDTLRVVVAGSPPFVGRADPPGGIAVEVWEALAARISRGYEIERESSVSAALSRVSSGQADVAIGPISITPERAEKVAFTQPYIRAALGIAAPSGGSTWDRLIPFLTVWFSGGAGLLFVTLATVGTLFWLAERRVNTEHFPRHPLKGIGNGIWMALVTMTTVGYGDRVPQTVAGRVVAGGWMLISMLIASSMVAFLATALTLSQLEQPQLSSVEDLRGRRVAVVEGTTSVAFAREIGGRPVLARDLAGAVAHVEADRADAVLFDRPALRFYVKQNPGVDLQVSEAQYQPQGYGFAVAKESPLRDPLDVGILQLRQTGFVDQLSEKWLGP